MTDLVSILIGMLLVNEFVLPPLFGSGSASGMNAPRENPLATSLPRT